MKKKKANLKTLLAVGGWTLSTDKMAEMLDTTASRHEFVDSTVAFLRGRHFDGLSLDFPYPTGENSPSENKRKYTLLCKVRAMAGQEVNESPMIVVYCLLRSMSGFDDFVS